MLLIPTALALILGFLLITFTYSAYEKISDWNMSQGYYIDLYENLLSPIVIKAVIVFILVCEILLAILALVGIYDLVFTTTLVYVYYALTGSAVLFLILLLGLRLIKDYEGASRIGIYFLVTITGFLLLSTNIMV